MSVIQELLEYQKVDGELRKLEQELAASEERKKFMQAKKFIETVREKLDAYDARAVELKKAKDSLAAQCDEMAKQIAEYADLDEMLEESGGDVSFYKKNALVLSEKLRGVKAELNKLVSDMESAISEYKRLKKQTIEMQSQYKEYNDKFREVKNSRAAEAEEINARLSSIAKNIPEDLLSRYAQKRKERVIPIVVPLTGELCICGMELSVAQRGRLAGGELIECEHCRRMIYKA